MRPLVAALLTLLSVPALAQSAEPAAPPQQQPSSTSAEPATGSVTPAPPASTTEVGVPLPTTKPEKKSGSWVDKVKLSGRAFLRYSYETGEAARSQNQFNLDRLYLQSEFLATDTVRFQVTLDAGDTRNATGNQVFFAETKYAFAEVKDFVPGLYARAGIIPLALIPYEDDLWGYRVASSAPSDRWGYVTSADFGLAVGGKLPSKLGSFQVNVNNGEGYKATELRKRKEVQARLTLSPLGGAGGVLGGLFVTGYGSYGAYDDPGLASRAKTRILGQVGLQSTPVTLAAEVFLAQDPTSKVSRYTVTQGVDDISARGFSALGVVNVAALAGGAPGNLELLARFDRIDPDTELDNNDVTLLLGAVAYKFTSGIRGLVTYETVGYGADVGGVGTERPAESRAKLLADFKF